MTKVRMNTELRNKLFNKMKNVFENEDTQEREAFLQARETVNDEYVIAQQFAKEVVERAYPPEDVAVLRTFKKKYGSPCDVVAKDKCFYFAHNEGVDDEGEPTETKSHFDFGLFGNLNGSEYSSEEGPANDKQPTIWHAFGSPLYRWSFASCAESTDHRAQLVI